MAVCWPQQIARKVFGAPDGAHPYGWWSTARPAQPGVVDADWIPGTDALAVIRDPGSGRPWIVEFPVGTPVHEARAAWSRPVSPDGSRVAFFEGPRLLFDSATEAMITQSSTGRATSQPSHGTWQALGLAWTPSGTEIWFTANSPGRTERGPQLRAVSLAGVERTVYTAPNCSCYMISMDSQGRLSRNSIRINAACQAPGEARGWPLGRLVASFANAVSSDGQTLILRIPSPSGRTPAGNTTVFRRALMAPPRFPSDRLRRRRVVAGRDGGCSPSWEGI